MHLFISCAGGFGREILDSAKRANTREKRWDDLSFIDDAIELTSPYAGAVTYAFPEVLKRVPLQDIEVVVASGEPAVRRLLFERLRLEGVRTGTVVDPSAIIADTATLGNGVLVTAFCIVANSAVIGNNVAMNVQAIVGHDVRVGDHAVISSMVNIGGGCSIGENSYVGMGAQIRQGLSIGRDVIIGMGSVVHDDIPDGVIALGNPARPMRKNEDKIVFRKTQSRDLHAE